MTSKKTSTKRGFLKSRFNVYRNAGSASYRVDMALPGTARRVGTAYVGELRPKAPLAPLQTLTGAVRALDSTIVSQDAELAKRLRQSNDDERASVVTITEVPRVSGNREKPRFRGDLLLASGRYVIEADLGPGEPFIVGRMFKQNEKISDRPAAPASGGSQSATARKPGPKPRG